MTQFYPTQQFINYQDPTQRCQRMLRGV